MNKQNLITIGILIIAVVALLIYFNTENTGNNASENSTVLNDGGSSENVKEKELNTISLEAFMQKEFDGRDLTVGQVLEENEAYRRYFITYKSGEFTISGIMNVPKGDIPADGLPVLILNHGYIDPAIYTNGRGLRREQDYLARRGYIVIHTDYRNHAQSDKDPNVDYNFRLGYVEDSLNAIQAVHNSTLPYFNKEKIGMLGHSMGGGVAINILVVKPELVDAAVLFAPVSADYVDNFNRWLRTRPEVAEAILETHGSPEDNPEFWNNISAINFLDKIKTPIMLHHGTADESVPVEWSDTLSTRLQNHGKDIAYHKYPGQPHEFTSDWMLVMQRTVEFLTSI